MNTNEQPEFDSLDAFIAHERSLIDERAAEVVRSAVAEFEAEGATIPPGTEAALTERVKRLLSARLDTAAANLADQLKE